MTPRVMEWNAGAPRRRAPGGGSKPRYAVRERPLMTLVWLRLYLTCDAVGVLFAVDTSTVSRYTRPVLRLLQDQGQETLGWSEEARGGGRGGRGGRGHHRRHQTARGSLPRQHDAEGPLFGQEEGSHAQDPARHQGTRAVTPCQPLGAGVDP